MSVEFYRGSPGKFDSRTLNRKTLSRWTGRIYIYIHTHVLVCLTRRVLPTSSWPGCPVFAPEAVEDFFQRLWMVWPFTTWLRLDYDYDYDYDLTTTTTWLRLRTTTTTTTTAMTTTTLSRTLSTARSVTLGRTWSQNLPRTELVFYQRSYRRHLHT